MKTLVAGFGNIFLCDDGFGCAVVHALADADLGEDVRVRDFGTGGMHLALEMLGGYDLVIVADAVARPEPPGTVFAIDCTQECTLTQAAPDAHAMSVGAVLGLYAQLQAQGGASTLPRVVVAGCVPQTLDEGMELSEPVRAAVPACVDLIRKLTRQCAATGAHS